MTCTVGYFLSITKKKQNTRRVLYTWLATYELFGRVYLRSSLKIVKYWFIRHSTFWIKLSVDFLCSLCILGTKDVSWTADFKRSWPINAWVSPSNLSPLTLTLVGASQMGFIWYKSDCHSMFLVESWSSHLSPFEFPPSAATVSNQPNY